MNLNLCTSHRLQLWHKNTHGDSAPVEVIGSFSVLIILIVLIIIIFTYYPPRYQLVVSTLVEPIKRTTSSFDHFQWVDD